jgi:cytochrome c oxidase assembly factor CtaG
VTLALWVAIFGCWHIPAAYDYTLTHQTVHDLEHAMFALAGTLLWIQLIDPAGRNRLSFQQRIAYAVTVFAFGQLLSDTLILWFHPLYATYAGQPDRVLGISPLLDQRLAGVVMMVEQAVTLGTCVTFLVLRDRGASATRPRSARRPRVPAGG